MDSASSLLSSRTISYISLYANSSATHDPFSFRRTLHVRGQIERNVLITRRIFAERLENGDRLARLQSILHALKLVQEARIGGPEQANIRDLEQTHGESLQADSERPTAIFLLVRGNGERKQGDPHSP